MTTLINAIMKIGPILAFAIGGYLIFIKFPFLFLKKSMKEQKEKLAKETQDLKVVEEKYSVDDYKKFQQKMKLINGSGTQKTSEKKKEEHQQEKKEEPKKPRPAPPQGPTDEEILGFRPGDTFTSAELKKRYIELVRQNHPDKVASMGPDFKKLAEKNTKEINRAFDRLKKKAS